MQRGLLRGDADGVRLGDGHAVDVRLPERQPLGFAHGRLRGAAEGSVPQATVHRGGERRGDHGSDGGRSQQPRDARDRVVDARGDARLVLGAREHRGGQRRDGHRQAEREHEQRGQHFGDVVGLHAHALEQQQPRRRDQRPGAHEEARPISVRERPKAAGEDEHDNRHRQRRQPALERRIAADLLQEQDEEEEQDRQPRVHRERLHVARREVAPPEQPQRQHRSLRAGLVQQEQPQQRHARDQRHDHRGTRPAQPRLLDQGEHGAAQPERAQDRARVVHTPVAASCAARSRGSPPGSAPRTRSSAGCSSGRSTATSRAPAARLQPADRARPRSPPTPSNCRSPRRARTRGTCSRSPPASWGRAARRPRPAAPWRRRARRCWAPARRSTKRPRSPTRRSRTRAARRTGPRAILLSGSASRASADTR